MEWYWIGTLIAGLLITLLLTGLPVAISLALVSAVFLISAVGPEVAMTVAAEEVYRFWSNYTLVALPLFILMGELLFIGGTVRDIFEMSSAWLRRVPGGLVLVTVATCAIFSTLSGSSLGAVATVGVVAVPEMLRRGYNPKLALGAVGAAGGLAHLIPPSILMVLYASIIEVSIGKMLIAGVLPGIVLATAYGVVAVIWALVDPKAAPQEPPVSWGYRFRVLRKAIGPLIIVAVVTGTVFVGIATATEAAALGCVAGLGLAAASKRLTWKSLWQALHGTARTTSFIILIAVGGAILSWVLSYYQIPYRLVQLTQGLSLSPWLILILTQVMYLVLGAFIDPVGMIIVTMPIVAPLLTSLGFDPIWFGVLLMINIEMALATPPLGMAVYLLKGIAPKNVSLADVFKGCLTFMIADAVVLIIVMVFPQIALWLPSLMSR